VTLLLDTQILLWIAIDSPRLSAAARRLIAQSESAPVFSAVSVWEIAIKATGPRDDFRADASIVRRALLDRGYSELPIYGLHAVTVSSLPAIHADPFDRLLLAQAITEGMTLVTADAIVARYPGPVRKV
jgi:PIN domain nuclease of toxin-antitoxin system